MVDMVKKVRKANAKSTFLEPGEEVLAASAVHEVGSFEKAISVGSTAASVRAHRRADRAMPPPDGSMAADAPDLKAAILAVTDRRVIMFTQSKLHFGPKEVATTWPRAQVEKITLTSGRSSEILGIVFIDGSVAEIESIVTAKPELVAQAIG